MKQLKVLIFLVITSTFMFVSCSEHIVTECETDINDESMGATFSEIQANVFTANCATSGCHGGQFHNSPNLEEGNSYKNIVNIQSAGNFEYVKSGDSKSSLIIKRITASDGFSVMPPLSAGGKLDQAVIDSIAAWIDNGAENN